MTKMLRVGWVCQHCQRGHNVSLPRPDALVLADHLFRDHETNQVLLEDEGFVLEQAIEDGDAAFERQRYAKATATLRAHGIIIPHPRKS